MSCFLYTASCPSPPFNNPNPNPKPNFPSMLPNLERDYMGLGCALTPPSSSLRVCKEKDNISSDDGPSIETKGFAGTPLCGSHLKLAPPSSCDDDGEPSKQGASVGWPPISSYRKTTTRALFKPSCRETTLADAPLNDDNNSPAITLAMEANLREPLRIKVCMDGTPIMRKLDLKSMRGYHHLSMELHRLFKFYKSQSKAFVNLCSEIGRPLYFTDLHAAQYILTYKEREGDWMLVGDTPWETFIQSARRIRIMKNSDHDL